MLDIVTLGQELMTKLRQETDLVMSDRLLTRDVLEARIRELTEKRDEELQRVDSWASQQKALISDVFQSLIAENESDRKRNEAQLSHMKGEDSEPEKPAAKAPAAAHASGRTLRHHLRAAE